MAAIGMNLIATVLKRKHQIGGQIALTACIVFLFLASSSGWPYLYYVLLRVLVSGTSGYSSYRAHIEGRAAWTWILGTIALLFNPLFPMRMARSDWGTLNIITAVVMISYLILPSVWSRLWAKANSAPVQTSDTIAIAGKSGQAIPTPPRKSFSEESAPEAEANQWVAKGRNLYDLADIREWNPEQAAACFEHGLRIMPNNIDCHVYLGMIYLDGDGVHKDYAKAFGHYAIASEFGDPNAQRSLAEMYENGYGVGIDVVKAASLYRRAAERGDSYSQYKSGVFCLAGVETTPDPQKAYFWFLKSAEAGEEDAQVALGKMYENNVYVKRDLEQAKFWYSKAAENRERRS
jgi:TPR repeat protein